MTQAHIDMDRKILDRNDRLAAENRELLADKHVYVVNLLASPGAGKTSTIMATIPAMILASAGTALPMNSPWTAPNSAGFWRTCTDMRTRIP
jgi:hypothetical protein